MLKRLGYKLYVVLRGWLGIKQDTYKRPAKLMSVTVRRLTSCGRVYITVARDEFDNPREVFFQTGSEGCVGNQAALGRTVSLALRYNIPVTEIIDQLKKCHCGASMKKMGKVENDKDIDKETKAEYCKSCADAVVKALVGVK